MALISAADALPGFISCTVEPLADTVISAMSVFAELIGLLGPRIIVTALAHKDAPPAPQRPWRWPAALSWRRGRKGAAAPATALEGSPPPAATPASSRKPRKGKRSGGRELGDVEEWKAARTVARPEAKVKPGDAYAAYKGWCAETDRDPVTLTAFGTTMKGELGVNYEEKSKRGFYLGLALVGAPKLVSAA